MPAEPVERPEISVLLPAYNCAVVLEETLRSLRGQTFRRWEALVLDDGSTDETGEVARAHARRDGRVRVIPLPHRGIPATLNAGLQRCTAALVARMDADDPSDPERLSAQLRLLEGQTRPAVVATRIRSFKSDGSPPGSGMKRYVAWVNRLLSADDHFRERYVESPIAHSSVLMPRSLFALLDGDLEVEGAGAGPDRGGGVGSDDVAGAGLDDGSGSGPQVGLGGYRDLVFAEDYDLWLRLMQRGVPVVKTPEVLVSVRDDHSRISRNDQRYSQQALRACKLTHLVGRRGPLRGRTEVLFWGAGRVGKPWLRELPEHGLRVPAVVDLHPRKLHRRIHGALVISPAELPGWWARLTRPFLLVGVGARGARQEIRDHLAALGLDELSQYLVVA
jgi:GT2 family glycosyltransferase